MKVKIDLKISPNHVISTCQLYNYITVKIPECIQWTCVAINCNVFRLIIVLALESNSDGGVVVWGVTWGKIGYNGVRKTPHSYISSVWKQYPFIYLKHKN